MAPEPKPTAEGGTREDLISELQGLGVDPAVIGPEMSDAALAEWCRTLKGAAGEDADRHAERPRLANRRYDEAGERDRETLRPDGTPVPPKRAVPGPDSFSERNLEGVVRKVLAGLQGQINQTRRASSAALQDAKRSRVLTFCERMRQEGRLLPAEVEAGFVEHLLTLDDTRVFKFSEQAKPCTQLDNELRILAARPRLVKYSEVAKQGPLADPRSDPELEKVQRFAEMHAEAFTKTDTSPAKFVETFKNQRQLNPAYSADKYLGQSA